MDDDVTFTIIVKILKKDFDRQQDQIHTTAALLSERLVSFPIEVHDTLGGMETYY